MSRIGRMPIAIPAGVTVSIAENNKQGSGNCGGYRAVTVWKPSESRQQLLDGLHNICGYYCGREP